MLFLTDGGVGDELVQEYADFLIFFPLNTARDIECLPIQKRNGTVYCLV